MRMQMVIALSIAATLAGCGIELEPEPSTETTPATTAMAQLKWVASTNVDEFDDSVTVGAQLINKSASTIISVGCTGGGQTLTVGIQQPERMDTSRSEEIQIRSDDEAVETISVAIGNNVFLLSDLEGYKFYGNYDSVELARRLAKHGKFRLRYELTTLTFDYDKDSAKDAIGKVLAHCGYELEPSTETATD